MKIEVACRADDSTKFKGDLLERLAKDLLSAQSYNVIAEIRMTGAERDLLCKHEVSGKEIYVECKAQTANVGAPVLRQLNGTVDAYDYAEGWLVSTAEFGKEAKGFVEMWQKKPVEKSSKLSFYTPERIVIALQKASVICAPPKQLAADFLGSPESVGEWILVISPFGRFWAAYTLKGGAPHGVLFYNAKSAAHVSDIETLDNISTLDSVLCDYDIAVGGSNPTQGQGVSESVLPNVVEVQTGESWNDYRPARPQDFIGREDVQKEVLGFLDNARLTNDATRIFAITGNSGLGKSSLVAKVRDRTRNIRYKNKLFTMAIDMRGARHPAYVSAALVKCLEQAQLAGFGERVKIQLTNPSTPLSSSSVATYLDSVKEKGQFICLIFDQFEELYSKPELFSVFTAAKDLMIDVASFKGALGLGFAWKTDSTTQQDHPAYHIWHELSDHRREYKLTGFDKGEISKAITAFEKEADFKLPAEIRHQISHSCQGFPWLLKKLCIHLYDNLDLEQGADSTLLELDVSTLFEADLQTLNPTESSCLKIIASKAPADWSEIIEISGVSVVNSLVSKRLVVRSGDRLNVYWDIFRDYLLTGNVPVVPFNYVPTSDISAMLKVASVLEQTSYDTAATLAKKAGLKDRTVWNIGADLVLFGVAERRGTSFKLHRDMHSKDITSVLMRIREKIDKHSLKIALYRVHAGQTINKTEVASSLRDCLPGAKYSEKTWGIYVNRFINIFMSVGYLVGSGTRFTVQNSGSVVLNAKKNRGSEVFSAMASPASVCDALALIQGNDSLKNANSQGYRNSISVLKRFNLIDVDSLTGKLNLPAIEKFGGLNEAVWTSAKNEVAVRRSISKIQEMPDISGPALGSFISQEFDLGWTPGSMARTGNALRQWANWIIEGAMISNIPTPPGRKKISLKSNESHPGTL